MVKRNKHGRFIVSKDGYLYDTCGYGCSTWGSDYQETIQFKDGKYYIEDCNLRAEIVDTGEEYITEFEIKVFDVLQNFEEIGKKYWIDQDVEVSVFYGEILFDNPIKVCKREYKENE
nr:MAG TPA: hypothetical protein [Caudoviricetes sp.]